MILTFRQGLRKAAMNVAGGLAIWGIGLVFFIISTAMLAGVAGAPMAMAECAMQAALLLHLCPVLAAITAAIGAGFILGDA